MTGPIALLALAVACQGPDRDGGPDGGRPTPPDPGALVSVTVVHGEGGGDHLPGSHLFVAATLDPTTSFVTAWTAEPATDGPAEWNGRFEVPDVDVTLTAEIRSAPVDLEDRTLDTPDGPVPIRIARQTRPLGVVMFFHGASYSMRQLDEVSPRSLLLQLFDAGYTVVAVPSRAELSAGTGGWVATEGSPDHDAVAAAWIGLADEGTAPPGVPRIAWGMSSGGQFAHAAGRLHDLDAVVAFCAPGADVDLSGTRAATGWFLAEADGTFPTAVEVATAAQPRLAGRGLVTELYVHPKTPVTPLRFTRIPGVDASRSRQLAQALLDRGLAGDDGLLRQSGATTASAMADLWAGEPEAVRTGLGGEIEILGADHELYDDAAHRVLAFLALALR